MGRERESAGKRDTAERTAPEPAQRIHPSMGTMAISNSAMLSLIESRRDHRLGSGRPRETTVRSMMEAQFGHSFEDVRVHADARAGDAARHGHARAYTVGTDIVFGHNQYAPNTTHGRRLLTHELAPVVQQQRGHGRTGAPDRALTEREAHRAADQAERGGPIQIAQAAPISIQKDEPNYSPKTPQVTSKHSAPQGYVYVNGQLIAAGTVGDADKFIVESMFDESVHHLAIRIGVWPGSDMRFMDNATEILDGAAASYVAAIYEKGTAWKGEQPVETWKLKQQLHKTPPPPPKVTPPKPPPQKPKTPPAKPTIEPKDPNPVIPASVTKTEEPSPYKFASDPGVQPTALERAQKALDAGDLRTAAKLSHELTDADLGRLTSLQRSQLLWGLGLYPENDTLDIAEVERIFNNTPDGQVSDLQRALSAGNGQLLEALKEHAKGDGLQRLGQAFTGLMARSIANGDLDWSLPQLLDQPDFEVPKGEPMQWLGEKPYWAKDLQVWKDDRGNWNFFDEEHGLTKLDPFGKRMTKNYFPGMELLERMKKSEARSEELFWTGGKHYAPGRGLLDDSQWKDYVAERKLQASKDAQFNFENLEYGIKVWDETQGGWKVVPSTAAHLFGGVSKDAPKKYLARSQEDVAYQLEQLGKAQTITEIEEANRKLTFYQKFASNQFSRHQSDVIGGGETTIVVIKVGAVATTVIIAAPAMATAGGATLGLKGLGLAVGAGGVLSAGRQGVQIWEGSRTDFSVGEVGKGMLAGGGFYVGTFLAPGLGAVAVGGGMYSGLSEVEQGHYATGAFDIVSTAAGPVLVKKAPEMMTWARPRVAGLVMNGMIGVQEIPGLSGTGYAPNIPMRPNIVMVEPGGKAPAFEFVNPSASGTPSPGTVAPNPSAFISPQVGGALPAPYNIPIIILPSSPAQKNPALSGVDAVAKGYQANPVNVDVAPAPAMQFPIRDATGINPIGASDRYWRFGPSDYIDPAKLPFVPLSKPIRGSEDEHPHATKGVQAIDPSWSKSASPAIRLAYPQSRIKTPIDNKLTEALKAGRITPEFWLQQSRANIWRSWIAARAQGIPVPTASELANAIIAQEAKMRSEGIIP